MGIKIRTDFEFVTLEEGEYAFRIENPNYDAEANSLSVYARVCEGDSEGAGVADYYNLQAKEDGKVPFGVVKLAAVLNATGIEPEREFGSKEEINAYYQQLWQKAGNVPGAEGLKRALEGKIFRGTVKIDKTGKYRNIVKYEKYTKAPKPLPETNGGSNW